MATTSQPQPALTAAALAAHLQPIHAELGRSQKHLSDNVRRLQGIVAAVEARHNALVKSLPELRTRAESALGEERDVHHRAYLEAAQAQHRMARLHNSAMHQLILARNG